MCGVFAGSTEQLVRERGFILWFVLIVVLVLLLNLQGGLSERVKSALREATAPIQKMIFSSSRSVSSSYDSVRKLGELVEQNNVMSAELVELRNEVLTLSGLEKENIQLREQLRYAAGSDRALVSCEVLARDVSGWWQTLRLGKGYLSGVDTGLAVITPDGLVGKTIDSTPRTADVLLITDPSCKVSIRLPRTGTFGILSGEGPSRRGEAICRLEFLNRSAEIESGDEVVTSGLGGVFPAGILVGHVETVAPGPSGLSQQAEVRARAKIGGLTQVFVAVEERDGVEELLLRRSLEERERP